ncbi:MAG TPA: hypothetical protein VGG48_14715 [Rhizomicrobium sp.]|jgi:hypothetical protein
MKPLFSALLIGACLLGALPASAANVCIQSRDIANTSVPDSQTILFHMKGGKVWKNTLMTKCPSLKFHGFIYDASPVGEICGNQQTIHVIETHEVCLLGPFTPSP